MVLVKEELGKDWLTSDRFRIGASSLLKDIDVEILKAYESNVVEDMSNLKLEENSQKNISKDEERKKDKEDKEDLKS